MNWCFQAIRNYAKFSGRACRKEYWAFTTLDSVLMYGSIVVAGQAGVAHSKWFYIPLGIYAVLMIIPRLSVTFRRLHDANASGAFILWYALPIAGFFIVSIQLLRKGDRGENNYGLPCGDIEKA